MYNLLLNLHSAVRWMVVIMLLASIYKAYTGYVLKKPFTKAENLLRHWTATVAHIQLTIGLVLYFISPVVEYFYANKSTADFPTLFFGLIHMVLMAIAIIIITIGSAMAKRKAGDREKFKTMLLWFTIALLIIFIAIPWPFSPLAARPFIRPF